MEKIGVVCRSIWRGMWLVALLGCVGALMAAEGLRVSDAGLRAEGAGQWREAVQAHRAQIAAEPSRADLWVRIADIEARCGNTNDVIAALEAATRAAPADAGLYARVSQAYSMAGQPVPALQAMEAAVGLQPANTNYLRARAELANWLGKPAIAADSYQRMLAQSPDDSALRLSLARARAWSGELDKSSRDYDAYVGKHPDEAAPLMEYARVESWRGDFAHAIALLDRYEEKFGDARLVRKEKARVLASADRPRAAMEANDPLLDAEPQDFELQFTRSVALYYGNRPREAVESVQALEKGRPDSAENEGIRRLVETPLRPEVSGYFRIYDDRDSLRILHEDVFANVPLRPETRLRVGVERQELEADVGSGLENIDGTRSAWRQKYWVGLQHYFSPSLWADGSVGYAETSDADDLFVYGAQVGARPVDSVRMSIAHDRDFLTISPRSVSLGIERKTTQAQVQWQPDLLYTIVASGRYEDYSDGNEQWGAVFAPRRSVIRSGNLNLDLGVRGNWFGYSEDLTNGYYDPSFYEQYVLTSLMYWKFSPESGLNLILAGGMFKDDTMASFDLGWSADAEVTLGAYSDWMLKVTGHVIDNFKRYASEAFGAVAGSVSLARRF